MASSKSLFLLISVLVLLISSELEAAGQESTTDGVVDAQYGNQVNGQGDTGGVDQFCRRRPCRFGCCRRCPRGCIRCCRTANEVPDAGFDDNVKN